MNARGQCAAGHLQHTNQEDDLGSVHGPSLSLSEVVRNNKISAESELSATGFSQLHCLPNVRQLA
jgi:hypothetical protein